MPIARVDVLSSSFEFWRQKSLSTLAPRVGRFPAKESIGIHAEKRIPILALLLLLLREEGKKIFMQRNLGRSWLQTKCDQGSKRNGRPRVSREELTANYSIAGKLVAQRPMLEQIPSRVHILGFNYPCTMAVPSGSPDRWFACLLAAMKAVCEEAWAQSILPSDEEQTFDCFPTY